MDYDHTATPPDPARPWPTPAQPIPPRSPLWLAGVAVAVALVAGGLVGYFLPHHQGGAKPPPTSSTKPATVSLVGTLKVSGHGSGELDSLGGGSCQGSGGYSDITEGAQVVITDDSGATLAITHLEPGSGDQFSCEFQFRSEVPSGRGYYGVQVSHRGIVKEREVDLGIVAISLGA
jgi:hypothetical protein